MKRLLHQSLSLIVLLSGILLLHSCAKDNPSAPSEPTQKVTGIVQDEDGNSVPGANIEALDQAGQSIATTNSDEEDGFELSLKDGSKLKQLKFYSDNYKSVVHDYQELTMNAGGKTGLILEAEHEDSCCGTLTVTVTSGDKALSGASVALRKGDGSKALTTGKSDSNGHVVFNHICAGTYNIRVSKDGHSVYEKGGFKYTECDSNTASASLTKKEEHKEDSCCSGILTIIAKDSATQAGISDAKVLIKSLNGKARDGMTGDNGSITFRELCEGEYRVVISKGDAYKAEYSIKIKCNDSTTDTRILVHRTKENHETDSCCHGVLTIIARDSSNNELLQGAKVSIWLNGKLLETATVGDKGAVIDGLCPGTYALDITKEHYKHVEFKVEMGCNDKKEVSRKLLAEQTTTDSCCSGNIVLHVKDSTSNTALANVAVKLWKGNQNTSTLKTNGDGVVRFTNICEGKYSISMIADGYNGQEFAFEVGCNDTVEFGKKLYKKPVSNDSCCSGVLKVRVYDNAQQVVTGAKVTIKLNDKVIADGTTNAEGWYVRESMCSPATYVVIVEKDGYTKGQESIKYTSCNAQSMTFTLKK